MKNIKIILIFLGVASAIVTLTFNHAGIMVGENMILAAIKEKSSTDSLFKGEKQNLIRILDSTINDIDSELSNLVSVKSKGSIVEIDAINDQIDDLSTKRDILLVKKGQLLNAFDNNWEGLEQETDSLLLQNPEIHLRLLQNS